MDNILYIHILSLSSEKSVVSYWLVALLAVLPTLTKQELPIIISVPEVSPPQATVKGDAFVARDMPFPYAKYIMTYSSYGL